MKPIAPGVYTEEYDFSMYAPALATTIFGVVGVADKGPIDEATLITNEGDLTNVFGVPQVGYFGIHAAIRYLRRGGTCWFVRAATNSAAASSCELVNTDDSGAVSAMTVTAVSKGIWGDSLSLVVEAGTTQGNRIKVFEDDNLMEDWDNVLLTPSTNIMYAETVINGFSNYISVSVDVASSPLAEQTVVLSGGNSGAVVTSGDIIGTNTGGVRTGLQLFADSLSQDVNLIAVPGVTSIVPTTADAVIVEMVSICTNRGDCMALIDAPYGYNVQEVVSWHNGTGKNGTPIAGELDAALNTSYAACYWPWIEVYDSYTDGYIWLPPSGHVAGIYAFNDSSREVWYAPAGFQRGRLQDAVSTEITPDTEQIAYMYGGLNRVNPFVNFAVDGITLYGQETLLRANSALTSINVRRLLLYARKVVSTAVKYLLWEPNDYILWTLYNNLVNPIFEEIKSKRGLYDFRVVCDETTNTAERRDRGEMWAMIILQPTRAAEKICIPFAVTKTGAKFEEIIGAIG